MYRLQKINRKNLDLEKYSNAIQQALNYRVYAEYWYLDVLTQEKWECWVWGDYEAVMPVPLQYKFGFKFVLQPTYCQQLGVFYKEEIPEELFREFEKKLHQYRVRSYSFNEENTEKYNPAGEKKVNYVLDLDKPYEDILSGFSKKRKKNIRQAGALLSIEENNDLKTFFNLQKEYYPEVDSKVKSDHHKNFFETLINRGLARIFYMKLPSGQIVAAQIFMISANRIYCMAFYRQKNMETHNASAFIKNYIIKNYSESNLVLDFEGSMISGVARFIEQFGAVKNQYTSFSNFSFKFR